MSKKITAGWIKKRTAQYMKSCEKEDKIPTLCALAYSMGFESKEDVLHFKGDEESAGEIKRALLWIEGRLEALLHDKDSFQAAKFILSTQFTGWSERNDKTCAPVTIIDSVAGGKDISPLA